MDETGSSVAAVVRAFFVAYEIFHIDNIWSDIEALNYRVSVDLQNQMIDEVVRLMRRSARWLLRQSREQIDVAIMVANFDTHIKGLCKRLP